MRQWAQCLSSCKHSPFAESESAGCDVSLNNVVAQGQLRPESGEAVPHSDASQLRWRQDTEYRSRGSADQLLRSTYAELSNNRGHVATGCSNSGKTEKPNNISLSISMSADMESSLSILSDGYQLDNFTILPNINQAIKAFE